MHEMSLITNLMSAIETVAKAQNAKRITAVYVRLGAFTHISPAHFSEHFVHAAANTLAAGARLVIEQSNDTADSHAQEILLKSVDVET